MLAIAVFVLTVCGCTTMMHSLAPSPRPGDARVSCSVTSTNGPDVEEIRRLEQRGAQANVEGWGLDEAQAFLAPEWMPVQPTGDDSTLDDVLGAFENGRSRPWAGRFEVIDLDVRAYCGVAVVVGRAAAYRIGASGPNDQPAVHFRWLNVWRKHDGRWVCAANQFARY